MLQERYAILEKAYAYIALTRQRTIVCNDGAVISVQAGENNASIPRNNTGPYEAVEVVTDVEVPDSWQQYSDGYVYLGVPVALVQDIFARHGGIHTGQLPPFKE